MRKLTSFEAAGELLRATLDAGESKTGLLIVSGGREIRIGAHRGMAMLAARIAEQGFPVFRFDRRGIGDSSGEDGGFLSSADDITAAAHVFRKEAGLARIVAFGNCDAATALALYHREADIDALVLANPWLADPADDLPAPAAIRARYAERLRDPRQWLRLAKGDVNFAKLGKGLARSFKKPPEDNSDLAAHVAAALAGAGSSITILLAERDNTARAFADAWRGQPFNAVRESVAVHRFDTASHSFAGAAAEDWVYREILSVLER